MHTYYCHVVSFGSYIQIARHKDLHLTIMQKSEVKLKLRLVNWLGFWEKPKYGETKHNLVIHVVDWKGSNLLGRDWGSL